MSYKRNAGSEIVSWKRLTPARLVAAGAVALVRALVAVPVARNVENKIINVATAADERPRWGATACILWPYRSVPRGRMPAVLLVAGAHVLGASR